MSFPHALLWPLGWSVQKAEIHRPRKRGPEGPPGMWVAIFAYCCQVFFFSFFPAPEVGIKWGMSAKHWYSQSRNAKLSCQLELNCIMRVSVTFVKLREGRGRGDSLALSCHMYRHTPISPPSLCASPYCRKKETKPTASSQADHKISILWKGTKKRY